jgi:hypothetical protein
MIPVAHPPATPRAIAVQRRGANFLQKCPNPKPDDWKRHQFWQLTHNDLYAAQAGICAYSASWTPRKLSASHPENTSIDHFIPKKIRPDWAYEWSNFRLCRARLNNRKDAWIDVIDPVFIQDGWFSIDFFTFLIGPAQSLPVYLSLRITESIERLGLNSDQDYVNERSGIVRDYCLDKLTFVQLRDKYPFIARQMLIQNFDTTFKTVFRAAIERLGT